MRIQRTSQLITLGVLVLAAASVVCAGISLTLRAREAAIYQLRAEASHTAEQLADGSDRLTTAVRGYAATGDRRYLESYQRELQTDRTRDIAMDRLLKLGLASDELDLIRTAKQNSDALVPLETRAMAAVARNQIPEAIRLVFGEEYNRAKAAIMAPIREARQRMERRLTQEAVRLAAQARTAGHLVMTALGLTVLMVVGSVVLFYNRQVVRPLLGLNQTLHDLLDRKPGTQVQYQDRQSEVGELARSISRYHRAVTEAEQERWVKIQESEVDRALHDVEQVESFAEKLMEKLTPAVGGGWSAFHVLDADTGVYRCAGGFGLPPGTPLQEFRSGVTLAGQAAAERKTLVVEQVPADYIPVVSGLSPAPKTLVLVPVVAEDTVLAVIEVATLGTLGSQQRLLLEEVAATMALQAERPAPEPAHATAPRTGPSHGGGAAAGQPARGHGTRTDPERLLKVDYSDPDYYWQSERAARMVGEKIKPDGRYHLQKEWFSRLIEASPEMAQKTAEIYQAALEGRIPQYDAIYPYRRPADGKIVWLHASGSLERAADGRALAMYGVYQDITESHAIEEQLRENERRIRETEQFFRSVLELAPDGLMVVDETGVITLASVRCEDIFGYRRDELVGLSVDDLVPDEVRARHPGMRAAFHQAPAVRELGSGRRLWARRKDGSTVGVEIGLSPLPRREGRGAEVAVSIRASRADAPKGSSCPVSHGA